MSARATCYVEAAGSQGAGDVVGQKARQAVVAGAWPGHFRNEAGNFKTGAGQAARQAAIAAVTTPLAVVEVKPDPKMPEHRQPQRFYEEYRHARAIRARPQQIRTALGVYGFPNYVP